MVTRILALFAADEDVKRSVMFRVTSDPLRRVAHLVAVEFEPLQPEAHTRHRRRAENRRRLIIAQPGRSQQLEL